MNVPFLVKGTNERQYFKLYKVIIANEPELIMRGMILCWQPGVGNALAGRITDADFGELVVRLKPKSLSWIETVRD